MRSTRRLDIYTVLILAMVPTFLAIAWGLTWNYERITARQACERTGEYLLEVSEISDLYISAGTLGNADTWLSQLESTNPPSPARDLHDSIVSAVTYGMSTDAELDTGEPGVAYDTLVPFQTAIDNGRETLTDECPEFAAQVPEAFPMFFREGNE